MRHGLPSNLHRALRLRGGGVSGHLSLLFSSVVCSRGSAGRGR